MFVVLLFCRLTGTALRTRQGSQPCVGVRKLRFPLIMRTSDSKTVLYDEHRMLTNVLVMRLSYNKTIGHTIKCTMLQILASDSLRGMGQSPTKQIKQVSEGGVFGRGAGVKPPPYRPKEHNRQTVITPSKTNAAGPVMYTLLSFSSHLM